MVVYIFKKFKSKGTWSVSCDPNTEILLLGDSDFRYVPDPPSGWEIHAQPGAKFRHITAVLNGLRNTSELRFIVVSVGINHREDPHLPREEVGDMIRMLREFRADAVMQGVSISTFMHLMQSALKVVGTARVLPGYIYSCKMLATGLCPM